MKHTYTPQNPPRTSVIFLLRISCSTVGLGSATTYLQHDLNTSAPSAECNIVIVHSSLRQENAPIVTYNVHIHIHMANFDWILIIYFSLALGKVCIIREVRALIYLPFYNDILLAVNWWKHQWQLTTKSRRKSVWICFWSRAGLHLISCCLLGNPWEILHDYLP